MQLFNSRSMVVELYSVAYLGIFRLLFVWTQHCFKRSMCNHQTDRHRRTNKKTFQTSRMALFSPLQTSRTGDIIIYIQSFAYTQFVISFLITIILWRKLYILPKLLDRAFRSVSQHSPSERWQGFVAEALIEIGYMGLFSEAASRGSVLDYFKYCFVLLKLYCICVNIGFGWNSVWKHFIQEILINDKPRENV